MCVFERACVCVWKYLLSEMCVFVFVFVCVYVCVYVSVCIWVYVCVCVCERERELFHCPHLKSATLAMLRQRDLHPESMQSSCPRCPRWRRPSRCTRRTTSILYTLSLKQNFKTGLPGPKKIKRPNFVISCFKKAKCSKIKIIQIKAKFMMNKIKMLLLVLVRFFYSKPLKATISSTL